MMSRQSDEEIAKKLHLQKKKLLRITFESVPRSIKNEAQQSLRKMSEMTYDEVNETLKLARIKLILRRKLIRECENQIQVNRHGKTYKRFIAIIHFLIEELRRRDDDFTEYDLSCDESIEDDEKVETKLSFEEDVLLSLDTESLEDILIDRFKEELEDNEDDDRKLSPEEHHDMVLYQKFESDDTSEQSGDNVHCKNCVECGREVILFDEEDELVCGRCFEGYFDNPSNVDSVEMGDFLLDVFPIQPIPTIPIEPTFPINIPPISDIEIPEEFVDKALYFFPTCSFCELNIYDDSPFPGFCVWCYCALMYDDAEFFDEYDEDFLAMDM